MWRVFLPYLHWAVRALTVCVWLEIIELIVCAVKQIARCSALNLRFLSTIYFGCCSALAAKHLPLPTSHATFVKLNRRSISGQYCAIRNGGRKNILFQEQETEHAVNRVSKPSSLKACLIDRSSMHGVGLYLRIRQRNWIRFLDPLLLGFCSITANGMSIT